MTKEEFENKLRELDNFLETNGIYLQGYVDGTVGVYQIGDSYNKPHEADFCESYKRSTWREKSKYTD